MESESIKFCRKTASDSLRSAFSDRDWSSAVCFDSVNSFHSLIGQRRKYGLELDLEDGSEICLDVEIKFDNNCKDFQYFSSDVYTSDGCYIINASSYGKHGCFEAVSLRCEHNGTIRYTVGDFVVLQEHSPKFATQEKPFLLERTTVLLPIKYEILNDDKRSEQS